TSPIILGIVLGKLMEDRLRTAMARVREPLDFVADRPIAQILTLMIVATIVIQIWTLLRARRTTRNDARKEENQNA
ncbi:MAG: hypothetical protein AAGE76_11200, partial [Pseudomonadota bacterium]